MGNRLREMLNKNDKGLNLTVKFCNPTDQKNFNNAMNQFENTGMPQVIPLSASIEMTKKKGDYEYPVNSVENIVQMMIYPKHDVINIPIKIAGNEDDVYSLIKTKTHDGEHFVSKNSEIVEVKMDFMKDGNRVNFTYFSHPDKANTMQELIREYKKFLALLEVLFLPSTSEQRVDDIKKYFEQAIKSYSRWEELGTILGIHLTPKQIVEEEDEGGFIEKFYLLLVKHSIIRQNDKLNHIELAEVENINIGQKLFAAYCQLEKMEFFGVKKDIFTVNCFFGAEICKIEKKQDGNNTVYFKDSETYPMYRSYSAFLCKEDAEKEMNQIENKRGDYEKAVNWIEQIREIL